MTPPAGAKRVLSAVPELLGRVRRQPPPEGMSLWALAAVAVLVTVFGKSVSVSVFPPGVLALPLLFGGLILRRAAFRQLAVVVAGCLVYDVLDYGFDLVRPGALVVVVVTGLVAYEFARSREETGLGGLMGDSVLVELRRRLEMQGDIPPLPEPWCAEPVVKPAGDAPFSGDFVVSALTGESRLEIALVDVSGKGVEAGTRSLLLSGALGGLLGAQDLQDFLPASNAYLVRQQWEEGFATAVHLVVELDSGDFTVSSAGHPPAAHFDAGSGRWSLVEASGPALGLLDDPVFEPTHGALRRGDALLLYTDGLVEVPGRDLSVGIDKLLGEAERLVTRGFAGGAEVLVNRVAAGSSDDRGLVLIYRR